LLSAVAAAEHDLMQGHWRKEIVAVEQLYRASNSNPFDKPNPLSRIASHFFQFIGLTPIGHLG
jgi:hypothetical protein